jgi:hypothetical protein
VVCRGVLHLNRMMCDEEVACLGVILLCFPLYGFVDVVAVVFGTEVFGSCGVVKEIAVTGFGSVNGKPSERGGEDGGN